jgi:hypothetical protein
MKKIKRFFREHRVFTILMSLVLVCFILIGTLLIQVFYNGSADKYGNRLEEKENYPIAKEDLQTIEAEALKNESVKKADIFVTGRIVYVYLDFQGEIDLTTAQNEAVKILGLFDEAEKEYYDFMFDLAKEKTETSDSFNIQAAKNVGGNGLIWTNDSEVTQVIE